MEPASWNVIFLVKSPSGQPPLDTHYVFLCVRSWMNPHSTLSAISGRKRHLWGGSFCQQSDHVDWFWLGHVRSISVREWENMLGWMEGCGVIYTSGPWSACNGSSEMTGFPMQAWERKCLDCWWRKHMLILKSPDLSLELSKAFNTCHYLKILFKVNMEPKWLLFNVLICTFLILEITKKYYKVLGLLRFL